MCMCVCVCIYVCVCVSPFYGLYLDYFGSFFMKLGEMFELRSDLFNQIFIEIGFVMISF